MLVRYFAAARSATDVDEESVDLPAGVTLGELETFLTLRHPTGPTGQPALGQVLTQCSFLLGGVATADRSRVLSPDDAVDVLPPFAGG